LKRPELRGQVPGIVLPAESLQVCGSARAEGVAAALFPATGVEDDGVVLIGDRVRTEVDAGPAVCAEAGFDHFLLQLFLTHDFFSHFDWIFPMRIILFRVACHLILNCGNFLRRKRERLVF